MVKNYIPEIGDLIWVNFDPIIGHEQGGRRPAVVLSPRAYNNKVGLLLCVPCTTKEKGYPFEVKLTNSFKSIALADQVVSLDFRARTITKKGTVTIDELAQIKAKISALIDL